MRTKPSGISNEEAMGRLDLNLELLSVDLGHSLNFSERNGLSIRESVLFLLMQANKSLFLLGDSSNVHRFTLFPSAVNDAVLLSKVNKGKPVESKIASIDKAKVLLMNCFSQFHDVVSVIAIKYNHTFVVTDSESGKSYMLSMASVLATVTWTFELSSFNCSRDAYARDTFPRCSGLT